MARTPIHPGLGQYFGMSADFWMNLQTAYELDLARQQTGKAIRRLPRRSSDGIHAS